MSKSPSEIKYPSSDFYEIIDGYDIKRTDETIIAIVVVKNQGKKDIRFYRWRKKGHEWKVDLARMSVLKWNWEKISEKVKEFKTIHGLI